MRTRVIVAVTVAATVVACVSLQSLTKGQDRGVPGNLADAIVPSPPPTEKGIPLSLTEAARIHAAKQKKEEASPPAPEVSLRRIRELEEHNRKLKLALQHAQVERAVAALGNPPQDWANVLRASIWQGRRIRVSWENPTAENAAGRQLVKEAIEGTWQRESGLEFFGWGPVDSTTADGIRIRISDEGPHCKRLGSFLNNYPDGMVLNFTFQNWSPSALISPGRDRAIQWVAVHEFGHALGFAHEQNRTDAPGWCQEKRQGSDGDWYITIYDPTSIMNYCSPQWNNAGRLSDLDIQAVRQLYGAPPSGSGQPPAKSQGAADPERRSPPIGGESTRYPAEGNGGVKQQPTVPRADEGAGCCGDASRK